MMPRKQRRWQEQAQKAMAYRDWLVQARLNARMTQKQVAAACGISRSCYQKYEYGMRTPKKQKLDELLQVLSIQAPGFDKREEE